MDFCSNSYKVTYQDNKENINIYIINILYSLLCAYIKKYNYIYMSNFSEYYHTYNVTTV